MQVIIEPSYVNTGTGNTQKFTIKKTFSQLFVRGNRQLLLASCMINLSEVFSSRGLQDLVSSILIRCSVNLDDYAVESDSFLPDWVESHYKQEIIIALNGECSASLQEQSIAIELQRNPGMIRAIFRNTTTETIKKITLCGTIPSDDITRIVIMTINDLLLDIDHSNPHHQISSTELTPIESSLISLLAEIS